MEACSDCRALNGQPYAVLPHAAQGLFATKKHMFPEKGQVEEYRCRTCDAKMDRDVDHNNKYAKWKLIS